MISTFVLMHRLALLFLTLASVLVFADPVAADDPEGDPYHCPNGGPNARTVERVEWVSITDLNYTVVGTDTLCSSAPDPCALGARTSFNHGTISIQCGFSGNLLFFCATANGWYRVWHLSNLTANGGYIGWNEYFGLVSTPTKAEAGSLAELTYLPDFTADDAQMLRLYWAFFNREPDLAGARYWLVTAHADVSPDDIAYSFWVSAEFQQRYGNTTEREFLEIVYQNVLGRDYDQEGFDYWLNLLETGQLHRGGVVRWIAAGHELKAQHPYPNPDTRPTPLHANPNHPCIWPA